MTISEQIELLDRCLHNRSGDFPCVSPAGSDANATEPLSFIDAIRLIDRERNQLSREHHSGPLESTILQGLEQAKLLAQSQPCPVLAITGLLNAGKTSMVAGFLSSFGQARLLIGSSNQQGTHRFVLWLPEAWKKHLELWSSVMKQLQTVFGTMPEELATDPHTAFRQYNGECFVEREQSASDSITIPLVATDANLDRWGIGLMDCPDVQTGIVNHAKHSYSSDQTAPELSESIADFRTRMLERALKIASAFVVVTSANSIQDESVGVILNAADKAKPGLKKILAVNRVPRRYSTSQIALEIGDGYRAFSLWRVYMAYHFDGPLDRHRLPNLPATIHTPVTDVAFPVFFRIDSTPTVQPPGEIPLDHFLLTLGSQLDRSQLSLELLKSTLISLQQNCRKAWAALDEYAKECQRRIQRLHHTIAKATLSISLDDPRTKSDSTYPALRLQVSREIVNQVADSLERTAPWWALPSRRLARWSDQLRKLANGVTQWVTLPGWISDRANATSSWVRSRWRSGEGGRIISSNAYGNAIRAVDIHQDLISDDRVVLSNETQQQIERIIERFQVESRTRLKDQQLDEYTREIWKRMSWRQRLWTGVAPAGLLFAPLLAVVMMPLDFGGTTVLVYASMKELLFAGMASVGMAMINSDQMPQIAEQEAAWQQLSDLFAISCDAFGIPRPAPDTLPELTVGASKKKLLTSGLPVRHDIHAMQRKPLLSIHPDFQVQLDRVLGQLLSSFPKDRQERTA